jgi:predicted DNA-binding transcriptional regulator YafY
LENKKIKPLKISNFDGYWYLNALNEDNKYRTYHIKSIKQLKITNEKFTPDKKLLKNLDKAVNIWFDPQKEFISVELFADEYATKYLERIPISKTQKIIKNADGTSTIYLEITNSNEIIRKLLMWIPNLRVITPKWLKEEVDEAVREYLNYN